MIGIIYLTENLVNGKIYIGSDTKNSGQGDPNYLGSGVLLIRSIEKYGSNNFKKKILHTCSSLEELKERESFFIKKYKSNLREIGYNISDGYWGGNTLSNHPDSQAIREKIAIESNRSAKQAAEARRDFYRRETEDEKITRVNKIKKAMNNANKDFFKDPEYIKNLSEGIKNSEKFQNYVKERTGKRRGKYNVDQNKILERRTESLNQLVNEKYKSILLQIIGLDNSTFSTNLKVYLHLEGKSLIHKLDEFISYLEINIYSKELSLKEVKEKFDSLGLNKVNLGKSTVVVHALYDFKLYGTWPQKIVEITKKF
jgi:hypothetical protein